MLHFVQHDKERVFNQQYDRSLKGGHKTNHIGALFAGVPMRKAPLSVMLSSCFVQSTERREPEQSRGIRYCFFVRR